MNKPPQYSKKTTEEVTPPRTPLPPKYPELVKITGERLVNILHKIYEQGGPREH